MEDVIGKDGSLVVCDLNSVMVVVAMDRGWSVGERKWIKGKGRRDGLVDQRRHKGGVEAMDEGFGLSKNEDCQGFGCGRNGN